MGENFNDNLKNERLKRSISQKEMAEMIGVAKSTYSLYESGKREPGILTIKKIADVLGVSADDLLGIDSPEPFLSMVGYTPTELEEIKSFAEYVRGKRDRQQTPPPKKSDN